MNSYSVLFFFELFSLLFTTTFQQTRRRDRRNPPITRNIPVPLDDCPLGVQVRKEYRDMTTIEWQAFREALMTLQTSPSPDGGSYSEWDWLTRVHLDYVPVAHE